jgi:hypothetical protein
VSKIYLGQYSQATELKYTAVLQDENGVGIAAASLTTLTLTVYALLVPPAIGTQIVNAIDHVNVLNVGRGTVDASGNLTILLSPVDMPLVNAQGVPEDHVLLVEWTYAAGAKGGNREVQITILPVVRV